MSWSNSASYYPSLNKLPVKVTEDNCSITINNLSALSEFAGLSIEEIRLKEKRANPQKYLQTISRFGQNASTPSRFGYNQNASLNISNWPNTSGPTYGSGTSNVSAAFGTGTNSNFGNVTFGGNSFGKNNSQSSFGSAVSQKNPFVVNGNNNGIANPFGTNPALNSFSSNPTTSNAFGNSSVQANPFGNPGQSNPFGTSSAQPYGNPSAQQNPFGSSSVQTNPFGNNAAQSNPFGNKPNLNNPFTNNANTSNPFATSNTANPSTSNPFNVSYPTNSFQNRSSPLNPSYSNPTNTFGQSITTSNPFSNPQPSSNSFFVQPSGSAFTTNTLTPSFSNQFSSLSSNLPANPLNAGSFNAVNPPSFGNALNASNSLFNQPTNFFSTGNLYQGSNPTAYFPSTSYQNPHGGSSFTFGAESLQQGLNQKVPSLSSAFKDPYGLTWIFPDKDPEELLRNFKPEEPPVIRPSVEERILGRSKTLRFAEKKEEKEEKSINSRPEIKRLGNTGAFKFPVKEKFKDIQFDFFEDQGVKYMKTVEKIKKDNSIKVLVEIAGDDEFTITITTYPDHLIAELHEAIINKHIDTRDFQLKLNSKVLNTYETVSASGIKSGDHLVMEYLEQIWPTPDMLPCSNIFKISPPVEHLAKMKIEDLKTVRGLTLSNQHGRIVFEDPVDVTGLDFDKIVSLEYRGFQGFPENDPENRLNRPALVTLSGFPPGRKEGKMEIHLKVMCDENGTEFVKYNPESQEFTFRVKHL